MPIVRMPDGKQVRFPDDMPPEEIKGFIGKKYPDTNMSTAMKAGDAVAGLGSGIVDEALNIGELPAQAATGARWLANKAGYGNEWNTVTKAAKTLPMVNALVSGSQALRDEMAKPTTTVGKALKTYREYNPKTTLGDYAKTTGSYGLGMVGPKAGMLTRAGKYVMAPALGEETLGRAAEGTAFEPYARAAGGLLGAVTGAGALNQLGERAFKNSLDKADDIGRLGKEAYEDVKNSRVMVTNQAMDSMEAGLAQHLDDIGFLPGSQTKANNALNEVFKNIHGHNSRLFAGRGAQTGFGQRPISLWELDKVSARLATHIKNLDPLDKSDRKMLWAAKHYIDDFAQKLTKNDIHVGGDLTKGLEALNKAKGLWTKKSKLELLDQMEEKAGDAAKARFTRGGIEHATRSEFMKFLAKDPNKRQRLTKDELAAFRRVDRGTTVGNAARNFGRHMYGLAGAGGAAPGFIIGSMFGGGPIGAAIGAGTSLAGTQLARMLARRATARASTDARALIASGGKDKRGYISNLSRLLTGNSIAND